MNAVIDENAIVKLYTEKHMAMKRIAKELNIAVGTVYNYLKRNRVKSRRIKDYEVTEKQKEAARKNGLAHKGKILSEETKRKISEAKKIHCAGHKKQRKDGYICVYYPDHINSTKDGYIMEHHLVMEKHIGRPIQKDEVVHHINSIRNDNRLENLQLMTQKEHASYHMSMRHQERGEKNNA